MIKKNALKIGDLITVGTTSDDKFIPVPHTAKVDYIFQESSGVICIGLDWGAFGKSKVYAHDEQKTWYRLLN